MMRRLRLMLLAAALAVCTGCAQPARTAPEPTPVPRTVCPTEDGSIAFSFGPGWTPEADSVYDLQLVDAEDGLSTGVFSYDAADLAGSYDPGDALDFHIEDVRRKRRNLKREGEPAFREEDGRRYTCERYSGEDGSANRFCYYFTLIEFEGFTGRFAVVLQTAPADGWETARPVFDEITASARLLNPDRAAPDARAL